MNDPNPPILLRGNGARVPLCRCCPLLGRSSNRRVGNRSRLRRVLPCCASINRSAFSTACALAVDTKFLSSIEKLERSFPVSVPLLRSFSLLVRKKRRKKDAFLFAFESSLPFVYRVSSSRIIERVYEAFYRVGGEVDDKKTSFLSIVSIFTRFFFLFFFFFFFPFFFSLSLSLSLLLFTVFTRRITPRSDLACELILTS